MSRLPTDRRTRRRGATKQHQRDGRDNQMRFTTRVVKHQRYEISEWDLMVIQWSFNGHSMGFNGHLRDLLVIQWSLNGIKMVASVPRYSKP